MTTDRQSPIIADDEIIGGILDELGIVSTRVDTLAEIAERVERMERMWIDLANVLGIGRRDRTHTLEAARWVAKGDVIQAAHGDTGWAEVLHEPIRTADMTGLVTDTGRGQRMRWWAHDDLIKVETPPVPDPTPFRSAR